MLTRYHLLAVAAVGLLVCKGQWLVAAEPAPPDPQQLEFFEKQVRPVLAERCYKCHGPEKQEGGMRVDSRAALVAGGDTGPAIVPGKPNEGYLLDAIRYGDLYQMPPDGKLAADQIAAIERWVREGAVWPGDANAPVARPKTFDLAERATHWAFQPLRPQQPPSVQNTAWPTDAIDRFILARLETAGFQPAPPAERATWLRRVSFAITGLPPSPEEVAAFESDRSPDARQRAVDRLLDSPHFGERWARHWLDLVRYAESRGHEFDYNVPNPWQYRDYLIRAFNADLPYNRLVMEHVAGDLLAPPRRHPEHGYNESILGTGFWFLGEWVHSPVDVRKDENERFDNMIDVFSKTFLGLTVACARCHDHKFDAISQEDYYALAGYLQSSSYRQARFETLDHNAAIATNIDRLTSEAVAEQLPLYAAAYAPGVADIPKYVAAAEALRQELKLVDGKLSDQAAAAIEAHARQAGLSPKRLRHWIQWLADPANKSAALPAVQLPSDAEVIADFGASGAPAAWLQDGSIFEHLATGTVVPSASTSEKSSDNRPLVLAEVIQRGAVRRRPDFPNLKLEPGTQTDPGRTSAWNRPGRTFRSGNFTISPGTIYYLVEGAGRTYAAVDSHRLNQGPLHGSFIKEWKAEDGPQWIAHPLAPYAGHRAHLEFTAIDDKPLAVYMVVQSTSAPTLQRPKVATVRDLLTPSVDELPLAQRAEALQKRCLQAIDRWAKGQAALQSEEPAAATERFVAGWMLQRPELFLDEMPAELAAARERFVATRAEQLAQVKIQSATAPALWEGFAEDEELLIRGNHKTPSGRVARRYLEALGGRENPATGPGSGRLQLAEHLVDPARNPAIARVIVNRVWHHLLGRGIVASTDNFGVLGSEPTHPELLDYLAAEFVADGWSVKRLIRRLVLTSTYAMDSTPHAGHERDPQNLLLHRMPIRRLEAEAIRDAILAVSGRLEPQMFGPSVPVYLTPFMQGRGRPAKSGPLDGDGRRSIYIAIRRNFLSPMMLAFDQPIPFTSIGRRNTSNVPAQALILMNDPFVVQQSQVWARRLLAEADDPAARVERMYRLAFARAPRADEQAAALDFLAQQGQELGLSPQQALSDARAWADLCHVMFNVKEFVFVP